MSDDVPDSFDSSAGGPAVSDETRRRGMLFLRLAVGCVGFALMLQMGLSANFRADVMQLQPDQQGWVEALREGCGILSLGLIALAAGYAEPLVGSAMLLLMAAGLGAFTWVSDFTWLVAASLVWSQGFHVWIPLPSSMAMSLAEPGRTGYRVGQVRAAFAVGSVTALGVALLLNRLGVKIRPLYLLAGAACLMGSAACWGIPRRLKTRGPRLVYRRKYSLYYVLSFLEGWRTQIFVCFAGYLLVLKYHTPLPVILMLHIGAQAISYLVSPWVGRLIDRVGERRVLVFYFACLRAFFLGYAYIENVYALYGIFLVDNAFFALAIALTTYVNRIAPKSEHTATLSMGVAANHVAAVIVPLAGGYLWQRYDHTWPFLIGAGAAALSVVASCYVPRRHGPAPPEAPAP